MKKLNILATIVFVLLIGAALASCGSAPAETAEEGIATDSAVEFTEEAKACIDCHADETVGIVMDWDDTTHQKEGISCIDCHEVEADSPMALSEVEGHEDLTVTVSMLVPPSVCGECHEDQVAQFLASGHYKAHTQRIPKDSLTALTQVHESQGHPEYFTAPDETGCAQCHGTDLTVDETGHPTADTYPTAGIGNVYPNGEIGNCTVCHTRHRFEKAEARKVEACGGCHIGPDHPDVEIFENSKHGHIYATEGEEWTWDSPLNEWEPGDYRAPTCATCHMAGIGELQSTHNVTQRLYWNLWAKESKVRTEADINEVFYGDGEAGREEMKQVCAECHTESHTEGFFASGDKAVQLYNEAYWYPVEAMRLELAEAGLLKENPWTDGFMIQHYHIWHHDGRRARQGSMMGAPDWAHWHGFFMLQQKMYLATEIYEMRMETGEIETAAPWSLAP
jgi:hydroxylamine dehydrogenase